MTVKKRHVYVNELNMKFKTISQPYQLHFSGQMWPVATTLNTVDEEHFHGPWRVYVRSGLDGLGYQNYHTRAARVSLIAHLVKNPPAVQETQVRFLGWDDPLKKGKATHSSILV